MTALEKLAEILKEQAAWRPARPAYEAAKAHAVPFRDVMQTPGKSYEEVAQRLGKQRAKELVSARQAALPSPSGSMSRLHPDVRGIVRGVAQPQALPGKAPGTVAESAKLRAEGATQARREQASLGVRTAPTVTAREKISPELASARGRVTPEQRSVVIPEKKAPVQFERRQQRAEAEAAVRGRGVERELGHERSKDIASGKERLRGILAERSAQNPSGSLVEKHRASQVEQVKLREEAKPSAVRKELARRELARRQEVLDRIGKRRTEITAKSLERGGERSHKIDDKTVRVTEGHERLLGKRLTAAAASPTLARRGAELALEPGSLPRSKPKVEPARAIKKSPSWQGGAQLSGGTA